ncbi:MAG: hypothetical protein WCR42_08055 [bacterium]
MFRIEEEEEWNAEDADICIVIPASDPESPRNITTEFFLNTHDFCREAINRVFFTNSTLEWNADDADLCFSEFFQTPYPNPIPHLFG